MDKFSSTFIGSATLNTNNSASGSEFKQKEKGKKRRLTARQYHVKRNEEFAKIAPKIVDCYKESLKKCHIWQDGIEKRYDEESLSIIYGMLAHFSNKFNGKKGDQKAWDSCIHEDPSGKLLEEASTGWDLEKRCVEMEKAYPAINVVALNYLAELDAAKKSKKAF